MSAVAGYSIKVGSEFETSLAQLSTIADTSAVSIDQFSDELKDLASETGQAGSDFALVAYNAISAGTDTADAMEMVKTATSLATGGFTSADSALSVLGAYKSLNNAKKLQRRLEKMGMVFLIKLYLENNNAA